jgi:hypothetical protein
MPKLGKDEGDLLTIVTAVNFLENKALVFVPGAVRRGRRA